MNNKAFTLIELMVTIVIIGLISFLGFPSLMKMMSENSTKEFEIYGEAMIAASKLYIQKEGRDLQNSVYKKTELTNTGLVLTLDELVNLDYIEPYHPTKKTYSCTDAKVQIKLEANTNTYTYKYQLTCTDSASKKKYTKNYDDKKFKISNF